MMRGLAGITTAVLALVWGKLFFVAATPQNQPASIEIAFVANAEAGTVALVDVAARSIVGTIDVNPARVKAEGPGAPNYAQDTDVSPDGRTLYVSRGYVGRRRGVRHRERPPRCGTRSLNTGRADHMTLTPDGRSLFVSAMLDNRVYRIATATGEITGPSRDRRLSARQPDLARWPAPLQHQHRPARRHASPGRRSAADGDAGHPFQLTVADVDTLAITRSDRVRTRHSPLAIHAGREGHLRAAVERACGGRLRPRRRGR